MLIEENLIKLAYELDLPLVATNDVYFTDSSMKEAHDVLLCIDAGKTISNDTKPTFSKNHYFKSSKEMIELFKDIPEAINNTKVIAQRCFVKSKCSEPLLPAFKTKEGQSEKEELYKNSESGLNIKLSSQQFYIHDQQWMYSNSFENTLLMSKN